MNFSRKKIHNKKIKINIILKFHLFKKYLKFNQFQIKNFNNINKKKIKFQMNLNKNP